MASGGSAFGSVADGVARLFGEGTLAGMSEGQLLDRFLARRDPVAFEALVATHGPMVLSVCRRVLRDDHAADDAFQATFLLLVRKADSIRGSDLLGPWLHRVAYRVSVRAGKAEARRRLRESPSALEFVVAPKSPDADLGRAIHEALDALPEKYRAPIVLCYLEGRSHDEAAKRLRWPIGSVKGRLSRARELLKSRLGRLGVSAPSAMIATGLASEAKAKVPACLRDATVAAASKFAAGEAIAAGTVSAAGAILAQEAARAMTIKKIGAIAASIAALGMFVGGAAVVGRQESGKPSDGAKATDTKPSADAKSAKAPAIAKPAAEVPSGPTGAEVAQNLRGEAEQLANQRDQMLNRVDGWELDLEILRDEVRSLRKFIAELERPNHEPVEDTPKDRQAVLKNRESIERSVMRLRRLQDDLDRVAAQRRKTLREIEDADDKIADVKAKADAAAKRPGKPNTAQVGDVYIIEVLEALPGRPISGERMVRRDGTIGLGFYGDLPVVGSRGPRSRFWSSRGYGSISTT